MFYCERYQEWYTFKPPFLSRQLGHFSTGVYTPTIIPCSGNCGDRLHFKFELSAGSFAIKQIIIGVIGTYPTGGNCPIEGATLVEDGGRIPDNIYLEYYSSHSIYNRCHFVFDSPLLTTGVKTATLVVKYAEGAFIDAICCVYCFQLEDDTLTEYDGLYLITPVSNQSSTWGAIKSMYGE